MNLIDWLCLVVIVSKYCFGKDFDLPEPTFEAYEPAGIRVSIPALPGVQLFGFHGNINKEIDITELGETGGDVTVDQNNPTEFLSFEDPTVKLKPGDVINYWIYFQHNYIGYRKDNQKWQVLDLKKNPNTPCEEGVTKIPNQNNVCRNTIIFQDNFSKEGLNYQNWLIEQYIPQSPDYEFVVYKQDADVIFVSNDTLHIKPKLIMDANEINKRTLDLSQGCTRTNPDECIHEKLIIQNPIISSRLVSEFSFRYGEVEMRAKLPTGDWIYPQIYLQNEDNHKIFIAYARGNKQLVGNDGIDIGCTLLFGGPVLFPGREPLRSSNLRSIRGQSPFCNDFHIYKLKWTPEKFELYLDDKLFGDIDVKSLNNAPLLQKDVKLVLGVGVGGITDFPDDFKSGNIVKPWKSATRLQVKNFYDNKSDWYDKTWGEYSQLQVDYVKIKSI